MLKKKNINFKQNISIFLLLFLKSNKILISSTITYTSLQMLANLSNLIFFLLVSKELTNTEFALYATLFAFINTFGGVSGGVFTIICRSVAVLSLQSEKMIKLKLKNYEKNWFLGIIFIGFIIFINGSAIQEYLKIPTFYSLFLSFIIMILVLGYSINFAVYQGLQSFFLLGFLGFLVSFIKIPLFYFTPEKYLNANSALIMVIICSLIVYLISKINLENRFKNFTIVKPNTNLVDKKFIITTIYSQIIFNLIMNLDILIVRYSFSSEISETYIVASSLAKIIIILSGSATTVLFPMLTKVFANNLKQNKLTNISILYNLFIISFFIIIFWFWSSDLSFLLYQDKYPDIEKFIQYIVIALSPLALLHLFEFIFISRKKMFVGYVFSILIPITLGYTIIYINNIYDFILVFGLMNFITLLIVIFKLRNSIFSKGN